MLLWIRLALLVILTCSTKLSYGKSKRSFQDDSDLPECSDDHSVCSYVELNSMGISIQRFCRCKNYISCPEQYNHYDGLTISHGNGQYKYCESTPRLRPCLKDDFALTVNSVIDLVGPSRIDYKLQCLCPRSHLFVLNETVTHELSTDSILSQDTYLYKCKSPDICGPQDHCMTISRTSHTNFVKKRCNCPKDSFCPTNIRLAAKTISYNKGTAFIMNCI